MSLSDGRRRYIMHQMELSSDWIHVIEDELAKCAIGGNADEFERLQRLLKREEELYTALRHSFAANRDTLALL